MRSPPLQSRLAFSLTSEQLLKPVVVMSLPTGSGKFCYWILPKLFDRRAGGSVVIVVSPLRVNEEALTRRDATAVYAGANADAILLDRADISNSSYQHCR